MCQDTVRAFHVSMSRWDWAKNGQIWVYHLQHDEATLLPLLQVVVVMVKDLRSCENFFVVSQSFWM